MNRRDLLVASLSTWAIACTTDTSPPATAEPEPREPELPGGLVPANFIVHGRQPTTFETRRDRIEASPVTPTQRFFVRNNLPIPPTPTDPDRWGVSVEGVRRAGVISLAELQALGSTTLFAVIQCSGNGRGFFEHDPSGSPWKTGAAGCAAWTGVPVRRVLEHFGGASERARFLTTTGGELDIPDPDARVERSVPLDKALADGMLVWAMNGEPLPMLHGGPVRLLIPGFYGCNQIKYVRTLAATEVESDARMMRSSYRMRPIGEKGDPSQPTMWRMNVKSWLVGRTSLPEGGIHLRGVALSGEREIVRVEVSVDGGTIWRDATLDPSVGPFAWRGFSISLDLPLGTHTALTRATDSHGDVQPMKRVENHRGYGNNSVLDHGMEFEITPSNPAVLAASDGRQTHASGPEIFAEAHPNCGACHTLERAGFRGRIGPDLDALAPSEQRVYDAITNGVGTMPSYRDSLTDAQRRAIAQYIAKGGP